jgi:hypothetical protein
MSVIADGNYCFTIIATIRTEAGDDFFISWLVKRRQVLNERRSEMLLPSSQPFGIGMKMSQETHSCYPKQLSEDVKGEIIQRLLDVNSVHVRQAA